MKRLITICAVVVIGLVFLLAQDGYAGNIAQFCGGWGTNVSYFAPEGQTFTAENEYIRSIGFLVEDYGATNAGPADLTVELFEGIGTGGLSLGSSPITGITPRSYGFFYADFSFVHLIVGETYTAILSCPSRRVLVEACDGSDSYAGGDMILGGTVLYGSDLAFHVIPNPACSEPIPGDLNGDCQVDFQDFAVMASNWLRSNTVTIAFDLDTNPNWTTEGQWQFGTPMGLGGDEYGNPDPNKGYTGQNVYGVNLNGDYTVPKGEPCEPYSLTAGPFDCSKYYAVELSFARWLNSDTRDYVFCSVDVSSDGTSWWPVWFNWEPDFITDSQWQIVNYDISCEAAKRAQVYIRWTYQVQSIRAFPFSGWNIDDIRLTGKLD